MKKLLIVVIVTVMLAFAVSANANSIEPLSQALSNVSVGPVQQSGTYIMPLITWGGDAATIFANGNSVKTTSNSILGKKGLSYRLQLTDDFKKQVQAYLEGETPFLRGTLAMINMASEVASKDPRTKPVVIYQMTWSTGGDAMVAVEGIKKIRHLKGKTIALQRYGPHVDYLGKLLADAGLKMSDVKILWCDNLFGKNSPVDAFKNGQAHAAMVIVPDALTLTSNGTVGTGSEGSVKGARTILTTKTLDTVISDVIAVRSDFFQSNKAELQELVHGLLLAQDQLRTVINNKEKDSATYTRTLRAVAKILLESEAATSDAEALFGDCTFVGPAVKNYTHVLQTG